jgi:hypothetical protein
VKGAFSEVRMQDHAWVPVRVSGSAPAQGPVYGASEPVGRAERQVPHDQRLSVTPEHRDLEQFGGRVPEVAGQRPRFVYLV